MHIDVKTALQELGKLLPSGMMDKAIQALEAEALSIVAPRAEQLVQDELAKFEARGQMPLGQGVVISYEVSKAIAKIDVSVDGTRVGGADVELEKIELIELPRLLDAARKAIPQGAPMWDELEKMVTRVLALGDTPAGDAGAGVPGSWETKEA